MASIQQKGEGWYCQFIYRGKRRTFALGKIKEKEAEGRAARVDYLLMRIEHGMLEPPPGVDIVEFVKNDGVIEEKEAPVPKTEPTLGGLRDEYLKTQEGSLEASTLRGIKNHFKRMAKHFGEGFHIRTLELADLQGYVDARKTASGRRGNLSPATIKKEIVTLRTAWNWGVHMKIVAGKFPYKGLRYPKGEDRPPFMTREEIERQVPGLAPEQAEELWEALYLTIPEIDKFLDHVRNHALHAWIFPLVATAAHTGARKSELLRMRTADVDFAAGVVTIREKKRVHDRRTTRRVPLSTALAEVLKSWLENEHPGGPLLFAHAEIVPGSKKRSPRTGYLWKDRPGGNKERMATVRRRESRGLQPLTEEECHHHFKQTLKGTAWEVIKGLHTLRHSFISACAVKGVDQRYIDEWVGHTTDQQRRRYRHLAPSSQASAIESVFG